MNNKQKIRIEIIPEDGININDLRESVYELIKPLKVNDIKQCKSIKAWTEQLKNCNSTHQSTESNLLTDNHNCTLIEGHKEKHRCECGFSWDII